MEDEGIKKIIASISDLDEKLTRFEERLIALEKEKSAKQIKTIETPAPLLQKRVARPFEQPPRPKRRKAKTDIKESEELWGRWLGYIGIFALIIGVSFFLKYAFENNWIGETGRVVLGIVSGIALLAIGQFLRKKYFRYSDILMGGGIAVLYLSIFAARSFYALIPSPTAFALMALVTLLACILSVVDNSVGLVIIGVLGGFLTPYLVSTGENRFYALFTYILVLDLGILGIAMFRKWNRLNYLGFIGTVIMFLGWAEKFYTPDQLSQTLIFATVFFILYLFTAIVHHLIRREKVSTSDLVLTSINSAVYSWAVYVLLEPKYEFITGYVALLLALLYILVSYLAKKTNPDDKVLELYLIGIAVVFLTVAVPLQLDVHWITLAWLTEAIVIYYLSFTLIKREKLRIFGAIVFAIGLIRFFMYDISVYPIKDYTVIFNHRFFLAAVAISIAYSISYLYYKYFGMDNKQTAKAIILFVLIANLMSVYIISAETFSFYQKKQNIVWEKTRKEIQEKKEYGSGSAQKPALSWNEQYRISRDLRNQRNTVLSVLWALYAVALMLIGIFRRHKFLRLWGMIFFFVTAFKVFIDLWRLGKFYRIVSSITFGVIALIISFVYAKYKDKLKELI